MVVLAQSPENDVSRFVNRQIPKCFRGRFVGAFVLARDVGCRCILCAFMT